MNKKLLTVGGGLAVVLVVGYVGMTFFLGSIVRAGVNSFGPKLTRTKVELASATISPFTGSGTLKGLFVGNPAGWSSDKAFYLGHIHVEVEPRSIFGDHIVIDEIIIDRPEFVYETKIFSSNIRELLKNIEEFTGGGSPAARTKSGQPIKFVVKKFRMTRASATLGVGPAAIPIPLPPLAMDGLGVAEGGITPDQLVGAVMKKVLGSIVSGTAQAALQAGGTMGAAAREGATDAAKKAGEGLKKLFGEKPKP
ncbi:MAG: hypothetical protein HY302_05855 [Opitutae bacterium]|nr:hypothetical protein [Opitutae bacterium]